MPRLILQEKYCHAATREDLVHSCLASTDGDPFHLHPVTQGPFLNSPVMPREVNVKWPMCYCARCDAPVTHDHPTLPPPPEDPRGQMGWAPFGKIDEAAPLCVRTISSGAAAVEEAVRPSIGGSQREESRSMRAMTTLSRPMIRARGSGR